MDIIAKTYKWLFLIGVFFIPFNSFDGISYFGEFRNESAAFFFLGGFILLIIGHFFGQKVTIPLKNPLIQILGLFIIWCMLSTLLNIPTVATNYFKGTSGINRFVRQYASLLISSCIFVMFYWNVIKNMTAEALLLSIRKVFLCSLIVASVYGFLETLILIFNVSSLYSILELFNYFPFLEIRLVGDRISSISYEPPFLAIYLITILGWMLSYIITNKGILKYIPTILVLILTFFSGSRTALIVISFQLFIFLVLLLFDKKHRKYTVVFFSSGIVLLSVIFVTNSKVILTEVEKKVDSLNFSANLMESVSNKSRIGIQKATWTVFKENPIIGVGYGQQAYHSRFHYPVWATMNNYEFRLLYKNQQLQSFPPGYNLYLRIISETGIIGMILFLFLLCMIFYNCIQIMRKNTGTIKVLSLILITSFIGFSINFLQIDTFRLYGFWICLVVLIRIIHLQKQTKLQP